MDAPAEGSGSSLLGRILAYAQKIFDLPQQLEALPDHRQKPEIPAEVFVKSLLLLWLCRLPSFNALEALGRRGLGRRFLRHSMPSADQLGRHAAILDVSGLRDILGGMYTRLSRNKVLLSLRGHRLAAIDAHEINSSYKRCCPDCQTRQITVNGQTRTQYYHRAAVFQLIGPGFRLLLDFELLGPHEDEGTAALRLIQRVLDTHPRCFDILLGDGLYPQARFFKLLRQHNKHALVVLKDERRDVLKDARSLFGPTPHSTYQDGPTSYQCWDVTDLDSWDSFPEKVRVVRSLETTPVTQRRNGQRVREAQTTEWVWLTTLPADEVPVATVVLFGHERWRIENEGFNELCNQWHANHYFHHHTTAITALWLLLFIAHGLFHCFLRNIKPCRRHSLPVYLWAMLILAEFLAPLVSSA